MTAITTHPAMTGPIAAHAGKGRAQQGAYGIQENAVPFSDMVQMRVPLAQPPADKQDKTHEAADPEPELSEAMPEDEIAARTGPDDPPDTDHVEPSPAVDPEQVAEIAPLAALETPRVFPPAVSVGGASRLPGNSTNPVLAASSSLSAPVDRRPSSGEEQEMTTASRTGRASRLSNFQQVGGQTVPAAPEPEMATAHRVMRASPLPHHDIHSSAQIMSLVRPTATSGIGLAQYGATNEHIPTGGAELKARYAAGTGSFLPSPSERFLAPAPRPALTPPVIAATGAIRPEAGLKGHDHSARTEPVAEFSSLPGFEMITRETRPFGPLIARHGPDLPQNVARQIAEFAPGPQQATEVRLNPEELGRVRMTMVQSEGTISVTIIAERVETLDLMRRHIGLLAEEFRQIGYGGIQFDFGPDGHGRGNGQAPPGDQPSHAGASSVPGTDDQETPPISALSVHAADGSIDIRL